MLEDEAPVADPRCNVTTVTFDIDNRAQIIGVAVNSAAAGQPAVQKRS